MLHIPTLQASEDLGAGIEDDQRPEIPNSPDASQNVQELIRSSWARNPATRPSFTVIVQLTQRLLLDQNRIGQDITPRPRLIELRNESRSPSDYHKSPSLEPQPDEELECASASYFFLAYYYMIYKLRRPMGR